MADIAQVATQSTDFKSIRFDGSARNFVPGIALVFAGALAPAMGLTDVFFARALAWVFVLWGLFFIYVALIDVYEHWEVTDENLQIKDSLRFWERNRAWSWTDITRMDVVVERKDLSWDEAEIRVYYTPAGEINIEREDRDFNPELARLIIDKAGLNPDGDTPATLSELPEGVAATYVWRK